LVVHSLRIPTLDGEPAAFTLATASCLGVLLMATVARRTTSPPVPRRPQVALVALAFVALWLVVGFVRGPAIGVDGLAAFEAPRTISAATTTTFPALPPFFIVQVQATVTEPGGAAYTSAQFLLVEPFTGWTVNLSGAGLAPSA
jgi:hypothetical protein